MNLPNPYGTASACYVGVTLPARHSCTLVHSIPLRRPTVCFSQGRAASKINLTYLSLPATYTLTLSGGTDGGKRLWFYRMGDRSRSLFHTDANAARWVKM